MNQTRRTTHTGAKPLRRGDEQKFALIAEDAHQGLSAAIDLVIIHNERPVRGRQPRTSLNPMIVLLAVSAWERLLTDLCAVSTGSWQGAPGLAQAPKGIGWIGESARSGQQNLGSKVLAGLTNDVLPEGFSPCAFNRWTGARPGGRYLPSQTQLASAVSEFLNLRNGIAHRCLPQTEAKVDTTSDADSFTVQSGWARAVLALIIQLADQTIVATSNAAGFNPGPYRLPPDWFQAEPNKLRGVESPGALWGGHSLERI